MESISFVVPCFNEEKNVGATVASIHEAMRSFEGVEWEIILIDDCSKDRTFEQMRSLQASNARIKVLRNEVNRSLGGTYKRGVAEARSDYVILVPGDNAFPASSIGQILVHRGKADIIIPETVNLEVRTWGRRIASKGFTGLMNLLFRLDVRYYNGAVLHRTNLIQQIDIKTDGFAYQAEAVVKLLKRGASYEHCSVHVQERTDGGSSAISLRNLLSVAGTIMRLWLEVGLKRSQLGLAPRPGSQR